MADKTSISLGNCDIKNTFDPKYKSSMKPILGEALKKGIEASGDFTTSKPADKDAKIFTLTASVSIVKDDKSKPPKVKVTVEYASLLTGKGSSGQQFKGSSTSMTDVSSKIDEDVKAILKDAVEDMTDKNGKMFTAMRALLKK